MTGLPLVAGVLAAGAAALAAGPARGSFRDVPRVARSEGSSPRWLRTLAPAAAFIALTSVVGGALGPAVGGAAALWLWRVLGSLESRLARDRRERLERWAPVVADLVADALAAGASPGPALAVAAEATGGSVAEELGPFIARLDLGADPSSVWRPLSGHAQFGPIGRAFVRAAESGGSVTAAMRRSAEDMRARERSAREAAARSVSVKAAGPLGACLLPAFVLVGIVPMVAGAVTSFLG